MGNLDAIVTWSVSLYLIPDSITDLWTFTTFLFSLFSSELFQRKNSYVQ